MSDLIQNAHDCIRQLLRERDNARKSPQELLNEYKALRQMRNSLLKLQIDLKGITDRISECFDSYAEIRQLTSSLLDTEDIFYDALGDLKIALDGCEEKSDRLREKVFALITQAERNH